MAMVGADIAALRGFARALADRRTRIKMTLVELEHTIQQLEWVGPDHDRFLREWQDIHRPGLLHVCSDLGDSSRKVLQHAMHQEQVSQ